MRQEQLRERGVYMVTRAGHSVEEAAEANGLTPSELEVWIGLYQEHGESVFEAGAASRFELELFKAKYPEGKPQTGLRHALSVTLQKSKRTMAHILFTLPLLTFLLVLCATLAFGENDPLSVHIFASLFCSGITMLLGLLASLVMFTLEGGSRAAKSKLQEISYSRTKRKLVDKQETAGGVSLTADEPDVHGALALSDDYAGALMISAHERGAVDTHEQ